MKQVGDTAKQVIGITLGWLLALLVINYVGIYIVGAPVRRCYTEEKVCCYLWGPRLSCQKVEVVPQGSPDLK